jgi:short-subunit dehydrogenase
MRMGGGESLLRRDRMRAFSRFLISQHAQKLSLLFPHSSFYPFPNDPLYAAAKYGVLGTVRAVGPKVLDEGITVKCVVSPPSHHSFSRLTKGSPAAASVLPSSPPVSPLLLSSRCSRGNND